METPRAGGVAESAGSHRLGYHAAQLAIVPWRTLKFSKGPPSPNTATVFHEEGRENP